MSDFDPKLAIFLQQKIDDAIKRALDERESQFSQRQAFSPKHAAVVLGIGLTTLRAAIAEGAIPVFRLNRVIRIPASAIHALLKSGSQPQ